MQFLKKCLIPVLVVLQFSHAQKKQDMLLYRDPKLTIDVRIDDLLSRMTLEEKIAQLQCQTQRIEWGKTITEKGLGTTGPVLRSFLPGDAAKKANEIQKLALERTRLGIPVLIHDEALHGLIGNRASSFSQAIGLASTWDPYLVGQVASAIGLETRTRGIRQVLSPVVNIARDVRWGRVEETYGEDTYLSSVMGVAFCKAIEAEGVITTPKHFVVNHGDGGRDSHPVFLSERELREVYLPPFRACFHEAGSGSVMAAYNALNDIPCTANKWLLTDLLRSEWGFDGIVVSDYGSAAGIYNMHHVAASEKECSALAMHAGLDVEFPGIYIYGNPLLQAVKDQLVTEREIDQSVRRILRTKLKLGLFEQPYVDTKIADAINDSPKHRQLARLAAQKSMVLLRNEKNTLPLRKNIKSIAVIGPNADSIQLGGYSGFGMKCVTVLEGIKNCIDSKTTVAYAKGCNIGFASLSPIPSGNLIPANSKSGQHGLRGEYFNNKDLSGMPVLTRIDPQIHFTWGMGSPDSIIDMDGFSARWTGKLVPSETGFYTFGMSTDDGVRVYVDDKLLINSWFDRGATLDALPLYLEAGKAYDLLIEYYENTGWSYASLDWDLKKSVDPKIKTAADLARAADAAIVVVGIVEGEGYDRANLDLPGAQEQLIKAVAASGTPTIVVLINGSAVTMKNWIDSVDAVLEAWYPGEEGGNAVADVLFGNVNPGGKLPLTFPQFVGQVPLYYNSKPTGRGYDYTDMSGKPLFPFGFGLSYSTFDYTNLKISPSVISPNDSVTVQCDITNTSSRSGDEVVQLYLHDPIASVTRPLKELKAFRRVSLNPGQTATVVFPLTRTDLQFLDASMKEVVEVGKIEVMVGSSSEDIRLRSEFEIK